MNKKRSLCLWVRSFTAPSRILEGQIADFIEDFPSPWARKLRQPTRKISVSGGRLRLQEATLSATLRQLVKTRHWCYLGLLAQGTGGEEKEDISYYHDPGFCPGSEPGFLTSVKIMSEVKRSGFSCYQNPTRLNNRRPWCRGVPLATSDLIISQ